MKVPHDRRHLTPAEVQKLIAATQGSRHAARDRCLLLLMFRHGLRVSEALGLKLNAADLEGRTLQGKRCTLPG
jgi:type 1 fimbriae regulatory protein FimB